MCCFLQNHHNKTETTLTSSISTLWRYIAMQLTKQTKRSVNILIYTTYSLNKVSPTLSFTDYNVAPVTPRIYSPQTIESWWTACLSQLCNQSQQMHDSRTCTGTVGERSVFILTNIRHHKMFQEIRDSISYYVYIYYVRLVFSCQLILIQRNSILVYWKVLP